MRPFEADCYADGWAARIAYRDRSENPYKGHEHAWDKYRERAWDMGWRACDGGAPWIDPRKPVEVEPLDYPCPTCGVPPGVQCEFKRLFDGRTPRQFAAGVTGRTHASRVRRARKGDRETTSGAANRG